LHLAVLGTGPVRKFRGVAADCGVAGRVAFAGRRGDIQRCYGAGDLFILPTAYEPFPNVNLEAMACGLPVLTTNTSGGADVVRHGEVGWLVSDVHAVAEMTACLDRHFDLTDTAREAMSVRCREIACGLTIEKNIDQTLRLFEEVLREKHG
jgi:UDP-glucose:(heptosyl)LPS alpha-1,3-glucosyltransferase